MSARYEEVPNANRTVGGIFPERGVWRPIESAPKDGTPVLIWDPMCDHAEAAKFAGREWQTCMIRDDGEPAAYFVPTHWMPLPNQPTE